MISLSREITKVPQRAASVGVKNRTLRSSTFAIFRYAISSSDQRFSLLAWAMQFFVFSGIHILTLPVSGREMRTFNDYINLQTPTQNHYLTRTKRARRDWKMGGITTRGPFCSIEYPFPFLCGRAVWFFRGRLVGWAQVIHSLSTHQLTLFILYINISMYYNNLSGDWRYYANSL